MRMSRVYTKEILEEAIKNSLSLSDVCRYLGKCARGATYELIKNRINDYELDTSHFLGYKKCAGKRSIAYMKRRKADEVLVDGYKYRAGHSLLKRVLLEEGLEYKCENCSIKDWNMKPITLDIDHIDGNWKNCKKDNLRFLCPNCHRQTKTFAGKNIKKQSKEIGS